jgi:hypothetical protein
MLELQNKLQNISMRKAKDISVLDGKLADMEKKFGKMAVTGKTEEEDV